MSHQHVVRTLTMFGRLTTDTALKPMDAMSLFFKRQAPVHRCSVLAPRHVGLESNGSDPASQTGSCGGARAHGAESRRCRRRAPRAWPTPQDAVASVGAIHADTRPWPTTGSPPRRQRLPGGLLLWPAVGHPCVGYCTHAGIPWAPLPTSAAVGRVGACLPHRGGSFCAPPA